MKVNRKSAWAWWLVVISWVLGGQPAAAHSAQLVRSFPANRAILADPPSEVVLWFDEELLSPTSTVQVLDETGQQVDLGNGGVDLYDVDHRSMRVTLRPLSEGVYSVQWVVMLVDGDVSEGHFPFAVGTDVTPAELDATVPDGQAQAGNKLLLSGGAAALVLLSMVFYRLRPQRQQQNPSL